MTTQQRFVRRLIIGVGNALRGDDEAGLAVIRKLRDDLPAGTVICEESGDSAGLLDAWQGFDDVVIIDAASANGHPGTILQFDAGEGPIPEGMLRGCSTHTMGVGTAIELARVLGQMPPRLIVYAIEGHDFTLGASMSPEVLQGVDKLRLRLLHDLSNPAHAFRS